MSIFNTALNNFLSNIQYYTYVYDIDNSNIIYMFIDIFSIIYRKKYGKFLLYLFYYLLANMIFVSFDLFFFFSMSRMFVTIATKFSQF